MLTQTYEQTCYRCGGAHSGMRCPYIRNQEDGYLEMTDNVICINCGSKRHCFTQCKVTLQNDLDFGFNYRELQDQEQ